MHNKTIRIRACLAVIQDHCILLVPHFQTDVGAVQWHLPGGSVKFGESLQQAAIREFEEEIGFTTTVTDLLDVSQVIIPERPWHSITITFLGKVVSGKLAGEINHLYGPKKPRWFTGEALQKVKYHPATAIQKAMGFPLEYGI